MVQIQQPEIPTFPPEALWSDEPPLETYRHLEELIILLTSLNRFWSDRQDFFAAANLTVYYSSQQRKNQDLRGPDFFVVLNTERRERKSWVVWEEDGKYPNVVIEILSDSTSSVDKGEKKLLYQNVWRTTDYFWFHPYTLEFKGFTLTQGKYVEISPNEQSWLWSDELQLYLGIFNERLRFFTPEGELVPTPEEAEAKALLAVEVERQKAELERQRAETESHKNAILRQKLLELGINPDEIG